MNTAVLVSSAATVGPFPARLSASILRHFRAQAEDWYDGCRALSAWEDANLLDEPSAERLAEHAGMLDELERVGRWFARVAQSPDFPDRATADLVSLSLQDLRDRRAMWHGSTLNGQEADQLLRGCFPE
jgi:hypothetical protein